MFARLGAPLAASIAARMTHCHRHGYRVTIDACPCVLQEGIAYFANRKAVACAVHYLELNSADERVVNLAAAVFAPTCLGCIAEVVDAAGDDPRLAAFRDWLSPAGQPAPDVE